MSNPFNQARDFFSDAFAKQESAAGQQTQYQRSVDQPMRHDFFPTRKEAYDPDSPMHSSKTFMEDVKNRLIQSAINKATQKGPTQSSLTARAGNGNPTNSVLAS
jgi:hypothetical protein